VTKLLYVLCLLGLFMPISLVWAWDGDWTQAQSGKGDIFDDPDSSQGKAGTDPPQKYLTPNPRDFADVDPEELDDYFDRYKKEYAPYALARIYQDLHYNDRIIPKGYYLIKPGDTNDGSPRVNMKTLYPPPTSQTIPVMQPSNSLPALADADQPATWDNTMRPSPGQTPSSGSPKVTPDPNASGAQKIDPKDPVYQVFVLKRNGKVMAVVPIHRMETYKPPRKEKIPKHALAWVEMEDRHPVLKFYYKKRVYCTDFQ
jgi:hypothetical protein